MKSYWRCRPEVNRDGSDIGFTLRSGPNTGRNFFRSMARWARGNALAIFISGALAISLILGLSYGYLYRWSDASVEQKQKLADILSGCPRVRASANEDIRHGPSSGIAQRILEDCAQEILELSTSE